MASLITLKRRIGSVKNTRQITKAMELVAASKMRRAQEFAHKSRDYRVNAYSLLTRMSQVADVDQHPLFVKREVKTRLYIAITSNSGLAGAYNSNIIRLLTRSLREDRDNGVRSQVIMIGNRGAQFVRHVESIDLVGAYPAFGDHPTANDVRPILDTAIELYTEQKVDEVRVLFTQHKSNILQVATPLSLLPAGLSDPSEDSTAPVEVTDGTQPTGGSLEGVTFEPSVTEVLDNVTERLLEVQLWQALLESIASEHSMRMLAMKNATDNASDIISDLTLEFNTARQAHITQELAEITGGAEAMKEV